MTDSAFQPGVTSPKRPRSRFGISSLALLVGAVAALAWVGYHVWDDMHLDDATRRFREGLRQVRSRDPAERSTAAATLQFAITPAEVNRAMAELTQALDDPNAGVRAAAAQTLGGLVVRIKNPKTDTKAQPEQVDEWTKQAAQSVAKSLSDSDSSVREAGIIGLGLVTKQPETAAGGEVADRPPQTKGASGKRGGGRAKAPPRQPPAELAAALRNGSAKWTRETAKEYYGYSDVSAPAELVSALDDQSIEIRIAAVHTLQNFLLGLDAAIPKLLAILERDPSKDAPDESKLRDACHEALQAAWPTAAAMSPLIDVLKSDHREPRSLAALLLGRIGPEASPAVPALLALVKEPLPLSTPRSAQAGLLQDPPCAAARALGLIAASDEVVSTLGEVLKSDLDYRHGAAAYGLAHIGAPARPAAPALVAAYTHWLDSKDQVNSGHWMTIALGRIAPGSPAESDAVQALIRSLDSSDGSIRRLAAESLAKFGKAAAAAVPKLRELKGKERSSQAASAYSDALTAIEGAAERSAGDGQKG